MEVLVSRLRFSIILDKGVGIKKILVASWILCFSYSFSDLNCVLCSKINSIEIILYVYFIFVIEKKLIKCPCHISSRGHILNVIHLPNQWKCNQSRLNEVNFSYIKRITPPDWSGLLNRLPCSVVISFNVIGQ